MEPAACPSLTRGKYAYDFGDAVGMTPLVKMYTLGHGFVPPPLHAGGLRYHGMASIICELWDQNLLDMYAIPQMETFGAALTFARAEGIIAAPEAAHGIAGAIREAQAAKEAGEERVILFNLCGHGHFDMSAYDAYLGWPAVELRVSASGDRAGDGGAAASGLTLAPPRPAMNL